MSSDMKDMFYISIVECIRNEEKIVYLLKDIQEKSSWIENAAKLSFAVKPEYQKNDPISEIEKVKSSFERSYQSIFNNLDKLKEELKKPTIEELRKKFETPRMKIDE
ncbi:hypothetical protein [Bacillus thuringiensis]